MNIFVTVQDLSGTSDTKETKASTRFIRRRAKERTKETAGFIMFLLLAFMGLSLGTPSPKKIINTTCN